VDDLLQEPAFGIWNLVFMMVPLQGADFGVGSIFSTIMIPLRGRALRLVDNGGNICILNLDIYFYTT
jgi:hypothetical protein